MKFEKDNKNKIMSNHEPPVKKRQRIEDDDVNNKTRVSLSPNHSGSSNISSSSSNSPSTSSSTTSVDELDHALGIHSSAVGEVLLTNGDCSGKSSEMLDGVVQEHDWTDFIRELESKQCVCGLDDLTIRRPFQRYLNTENGSVVTPLNDWPSDRVLKYLSNLQLFFDIYLKQNARGTICGKFVELCECIINTNGLNLLEDVLELCNSRIESMSKTRNGSVATSKYILYLSGRVISCYLIIIKEELDHKWLKKIVDNLFIFEKLNDLAIRKINFSLDIIKYIIEFKDMDEHPLEEDINEQLAVNLPPPIETNYFAQQYFGPNASSSSSSSTTSILFRNLGDSSSHNNSNARSHATTDCHFVTLTDSESFDTTQIKCVTVQILENKWPALVNTMRDMIQKHRDIVHAETCTLTFLSLWENIISVKANLSVVETLPFYAQLDKFELLLCSHLSPIIYKQMLALFNEALCYGSTLALQDILPEETCNLAHHIVRHVRDFRFLEFLPRQRTSSVETTSVGFAGQSIIEYPSNTLETSSHHHHHQTSPSPAIPLATTYDRTLLQKQTLLVLKSVAVSVKQIRSDSSDSSIDSQDYEALQDMIVIERSIRDVLTRLETFIKNALEFHPAAHFSKILINLFSDQDDYLIEAMVCTLDVTASISFRNNAFPELVAMLNPVYTFLEFLNMISNSSDLLLDLLVSNETCFLLYLLRYLKYIRINWSMFVQSCQDDRFGNNCLDETMSVLIRLRLKISRLVSKSLYPYDISPILRLLESCESLYEGNELS